MNIPAEYVPIIVAIVAGIFSGLGGSWWLNRSNAASALAGAAKILIEPLEKRVTTLEAENKEKDRENKELCKKLRDVEVEREREMERAKGAAMRNEREMTDIRERLEEAEKDRLAQKLLIEDLSGKLGRLTMSLSGVSKESKKQTEIIRVLKAWIEQAREIMMANNIVPPALDLPV